MKEHIEIEHKVLINKDEYNILFDSFNFPKPILQVNTYYDTLDNYLKSNKSILRIRTKDSKYILTLKIKNITGISEYETLVSTNDINSEEIKTLLLPHNIDLPLYEIGETRTYRSSIVTDYAEISLDHNYYNNIEDYEIEYELLNTHNSIDEFNKLLQLVNLTFSSNCKSKFERMMNSKK